jgi:hypothetical protein
MNFHSWAYLYCRSQPRIKFISYGFFPIGNFDLLGPFQKSTRNIRGGVTQITLGLFVVFLVASPADWILREFPNFSSLHATGDMHRYFRLEIWNGFPSTDSSKVLRRCRTSRMLAPGGVGQKRELGIKTAAQPT